MYNSRNHSKKTDTVSTQHLQKPQFWVSFAQFANFYKLLKTSGRFFSTILFVIALCCWLGPRGFSFSWPTSSTCLVLGPWGRLHVRSWPQSAGRKSKWLVWKTKCSLFRKVEIPITNLRDKSHSLLSKFCLSSLFCLKPPFFEILFVLSVVKILEDIINFFTI